MWELDDDAKLLPCGLTVRYDLIEFEAEEWACENYHYHNISLPETLFSSDSGSAEWEELNTTPLRHRLQGYSSPLTTASAVTTAASSAQTTSSSQAATATTSSQAATATTSAPATTSALSSASTTVIATSVAATTSSTTSNPSQASSTSASAPNSATQSTYNESPGNGGPADETTESPDSGRYTYSQPTFAEDAAPYETTGSEDNEPTQREGPTEPQEQTTESETNDPIQPTNPQDQSTTQSEANEPIQPQEPTEAQETTESETNNPTQPANPQEPTNPQDETTSIEGTTKSDWSPQPTFYEGPVGPTYIETTSNDVETTPAPREPTDPAPPQTETTNEASETTESGPNHPTEPQPPHSETTEIGSTEQTVETTTESGPHQPTEPNPPQQGTTRSTDETETTETAETTESGPHEPTQPQPPHETTFYEGTAGVETTESGPYQPTQPQPPHETTFYEGTVGVETTESGPHQPTQPEPPHPETTDSVETTKEATDTTESGPHQPTQPEPHNPRTTDETEETTEVGPTQYQPTQPEPTQPTQPTQPQPTQPEPTQPEPTQPEPTQPHPHSETTKEDVETTIGWPHEPTQRPTQPTLPGPLTTKEPESTRGTPFDIDSNETFPSGPPLTTGDSSPLETTDVDLPPWIEGPFCDGFRFSLRRKKLLARLDYLLEEIHIHPSTRDCYPTGIVHNYSIGNLENLGFVPCYLAKYSDKTDFDAIMENCPTYIGDADFNMPLFFGACETRDCETIYVGSFTNDNRLLTFLSDPTQSGDFSVVVNEKTVWYAVKKLSRKLLSRGRHFISWIGFSPDPTVDFAKEHCDQFDVLGDDRLCWMTNHVDGGYRAGKNVDLDDDKSWYKVLFYANRSANFYEACGYETKAIKLNDMGVFRIRADEMQFNVVNRSSKSAKLVILALFGVVISFLILLCWKFNHKWSPKKACQWFAANKNTTISGLVNEEYKPLLVTTD
ncbi:hypothetical protein RFI_03794 [Reticulomyxa filosa]|uniref:Uncharacterized protein n=1 Tax=Reticulomyxa filosa TaxID=46433 RepID=X6P548_RETFI|nr:hypothetical protein RFI_03794 [Reticulomyxa filosa]|eukprot:ETO33311.1 hypothetical protein RFI_03794 [Reticulomyxa filosa]